MWGLRPEVHEKLTSIILRIFVSVHSIASLLYLVALTLQFHIQASKRLEVPYISAGYNWRHLDSGNSFWTSPSNSNTWWKMSPEYACEVSIPSTPRTSQETASRGGTVPLLNNKSNASIIFATLHHYWACYPRYTNQSYYLVAPAPRQQINEMLVPSHQLSKAQTAERIVICNCLHAHRSLALRTK
jgi:hypothetical protein